MSNAVLSGGSGLNGALKAIAERLSNARAVNVGFQDGSTDDKGMSNATKAFLNEYGTSKTPSRPFFRNMIAKEKPSLHKKLSGALKANNFDATKALGGMGLYLEDALKQSINDLTSPALSPATIAKKGFNKPLIDTSSMIKSITSEVV